MYARKIINQSVKGPELRKSTGTRVSGIAVMIYLVLIVLSVVAAIIEALVGADLWILISTIVVPELIGLYILFAVKVADQWEKAVILRFGKFIGLRGPGLFWIIPVVDRTPIWIDHRVMVTPFSAEKTLTKDTVPVDVDAVLFWLVWDAEKAALEVEDYRVAIADRKRAARS